MAAAAALRLGVQNLGMARSAAGRDGAALVPGSQSKERKQGLLRRPMAPPIVQQPPPRQQSAELAGPSGSEQPPTGLSQRQQQQVEETRPFWLKPLQSAGSRLAFLEESPNDFFDSESEQMPSSPEEQLTAEEAEYWARVEAMHESLTAIEVEILSVKSDGVLTCFGPLFAFLPAWELGTDRKIPSFSSWAQMRGVDVTQKKAGTGILSQPREDRNQVLTSKVKRLERLAPDAGLVTPTSEERQRLLEEYKQEREDQLLALIGKTATGVITSLDKARRRLTISERRSEGAAFELARKKALLIASLKIGDIVTCLVKSISPIGAFVELEGVPALIHSSELSWNRVRDPTAVLSPGEEVEAKVSRLDRHLQRISLSLRQMQADPLQETLQSLISGKDMAPETAGQPVAELADFAGLDAVLGALAKTDGVIAVVRGRRFRGAAVTSSFQLFLSEPMANGYKLLARTGNEVQEVLVQTSLGQEELKKMIATLMV